MDGDFPGDCLCGSIDFERIVVQRQPNAPITTDFVACLSCRAILPQLQRDVLRTAAADRRDAQRRTDRWWRDRRSGRRPLMQ